MLFLISFHIRFLFRLLCHRLQINPRNPLIVHYLDIQLKYQQFDTLFEYVDNKVTTIVDASVDYQDSQLLEDFEDLFDVHTILGETKQEYEKKLEKARAKQPKAEW